MSFTEAGGGILYVRGADGRQYRLRMLTMGEIAEFGDWLTAGLRERFKLTLGEYQLSPGQCVAAMTDFEQSPLTLTQIMRGAQTPRGADQVVGLGLRANHAEVKQLEILGDPLARAELAARLIGLTAPVPVGPEAAADPSQPATSGG